MDIEKIFRNTNTQSYRPYIIAEVGVNHECNMDIAKKLINDAVEGGADAVKFQTYKASSLASQDITCILGYNKGKNTQSIFIISKVR